MSIFKRLSTTISARLDQAVGEIENHDALVKASLKDLHRKVAEASVRLSRVKQEATQLKHQIEKLSTDAERWRQRARECAASDESRALECVGRARVCDQQIQQLESIHAQYEKSISKLTKDVSSAEQRVREIKQQHSLMRARQSTCSVISATQEAGNQDIELLNDTFDRWEVKLRQAETMIDSDPGIDHLELEFNEQENAEELKQELAELLADNRGDQS